MATQYVKLDGGERVLCRTIAAIGKKGNQLFLNNADGGLIVAPRYASEEEAELDLVSINEQLDQWENDQEALSAAAVQPTRRNRF
jgi:hypothetical protein